MLLRSTTASFVARTVGAVQVALNYFVKSTGCEASLSLTVVWTAKKGFQVKITQQNTIHNHSLDSTPYDNHPANRRVDDKDVIGFVDELQMAGAKKKLILEYLSRKTGKQVTLRDVHNLVQKLKESRRGSTTVETRLDCILRDFCSSRKGNTATIYVDDDKLAQTITFQTHQMRRFFEAFPEVLMIDATHNTNDARYKLFSFMIHDVFGHVSGECKVLIVLFSNRCVFNVTLLWLCVFMVTLLWSWHDCDFYDAV